MDERPQDTTDAEVESDEARWGDPIRIVVEGLEPGRPVRVDLSNGSWAELSAASDGSVDLARDVPMAGTWTAADVDGPFWSAPVSSTPVFDVTVTVSDAQTTDEIVSKGFHRRPVNVGVETTEIDDGTKVGVLSRPHDDGTKRPAILAFGGSEGGTSTGEFMAYYLSQLGYVSFGVGYFGAMGLPDGLEDVPLELLKEDLDFLASQPDVDPEKIAVLGGSRGGELALLLGATFPDRVHAVIAQVPSGYVWGATTDVTKSAWTWNGVELPPVPSSGGFPETVMKHGKSYWAERQAFLDDMAAATQDELEAARIKVEQTQGPIFMVAGDDDQLWPSCVLAQVAWDGLTAHGHTSSFADEVHCYPNAGHFITFPPGSSTLESDGYYSTAYRHWFLVGGEPEGIAHAERQGNTAMRKFLDTAFGPQDSR